MDESAEEVGTTEGSVTNAVAGIYPDYQRWIAVRRLWTRVYTKLATTAASPGRKYVVVN
jgi:hypothetical protein